MENYLYTCQYCSKEYKPNRRQKQKYCSNSCRTRAFVIRKLKGSNIPATENKNTVEKKSEGITLTGIGNAAIGIMIVNLLKSFFMNPANKPATKKDLEDTYRKHNQRHHPIKNYPNRFDGARPFYDLQTQSIVYVPKPTNNGT